MLAVNVAYYWLILLVVDTGQDGNGPTPDKRGDLKGSTQHWLAVYPPEFEIPRFVVAGY